MKLRKAGLAAAAAATVGAGVIGGAAIASASDDGGAVAHRYGYGAPGGPGGPEAGGFGWAHGGPFADDADEVSGDALSKVTAAVKAHDDTLSVDHVVLKDDGSYVVLATGDDEARHLLTVSEDLATVEEADGPGFGGPGHGPGGPLGGSEVTGNELTKLTAAVTGYDDSLTVEHAFQRGDDGDYFVMATGADDTRTALKVSADLKTVEELDGPALGGPGGPGGRGPGGGPGHGPWGSDDSEAPSGAPSAEATPSSAT